MGILHEEEVGLTTKEALNRLHKDIEHVLNQFLSSQKSRRSKSWIRDAVHHTSRYTTVNWISASCLLLISISFISAHIVDDTIFLVPQGVLIFIFLLLNITTELYDNKLRHNEVPNRVKLVLDKIRQETSRVVWSTENYPHLCSPYSPCITLQWTYRDNKLVNLPWSLLVKDDIILIRPGQVSPGYCEAVDKSNEYSLLHAKEVYGPSLQSANEVFSNPKARKPLEFRKYKLLETPYLNNLRVALEQSLDKPITQLNQQRHLVMIKITERFVLPIVLVTVYIINLVRYLYLHSYFGRGNAVDMFLIVPFSTALPLLPVIFPIVWNMLNYLGLARFKTLFDATMKVKINENPFEEDHDKLLINDKGLKCSRRETLCNFLKVFLGQSDIMTRSSNVVHVLGSLTALCCVDKKGILSWPNPTAEKVFFLHNKGNLSQSSSLANLNDLSVDPDSSASTPKHNYQSEGSNAAIAEVLDLTHNLNDPFKLHFDDTKWHKHLNSLKPLGLAILLNTCNLETMEQYTSFCSHITCEAMYNEHLIPVTNRRCLCELAKEIGFIEQAQKVFNLEQQLFSYRHLQPEMVRRDYKYARSLHLSTKLKFPFPHMFAVVVKEISSGSIQLLSEGTADIILDSCVDYWDGHDLCTLTPADRKKVQDFYQRSSLTAYCTAFAYRPLNKIVSSKLSSMYLELPSDSRHLYLNQHSPSSMHWDCRSVLEPKIRTHYSQFYSTDSLLCSDTPCSDVSDADSCFEMQCNQVFIGMVTMQYQAIYDMVQLIEELERACIRFVHFSKENELRSRVFSEKMGLESGWNCHISLLSERNRGEAGQQDVKSSKNVTARTPPLNDASLRKSPGARRLLCSALPTYDVKCFHNFNSNLNSSRTMSFSAPSAINMDHSVVKFDTDHEHPQKVVSENNSNADVNNAMSQEQIDCQTTDTNVGTHDWQSLSCLTDSTEQSAPINFDMSNRAKLPRGIDKIRPHIEFIDNVPLLVSLFTDCTALVTREMLHIMQDYGEVVCVLGSSANCDNIGIFMQADASIAVEPLYPQVCQKEEPFKKIPDEKFISPTELSRSLNSIACSLSIRREDPNCIHHLIMEARDYTAHLWSAVQFWLCCCFTLSFTQLVASVFMLPSPLTTGQIMWFVCFVVPLLSTSLMCYKTNPDVMKKPRGKNQIIINMEVIFFILWCYGLKFVPTVLVAIASFVGILASHCVKTCDIHNCTCALFYIPVETDGSETLGGWVEMSYTLLISRQIIVLVVLLHFVTISVCFVHREYSLWNRSPHTNIFWLATIIVLIILHSVYTILSCLDIHSRFEKLIQFNIPISVIAFAFTSPLVILITNEIIKQQEIRVNKRFQRRARLDFGTKLGMNSPF